MSAAAFPYYYGAEAEMYTFYRVPKVLFTDPVFGRLSTEARLLYGLLLDRMQLSAKNGWMDEDGKVFIYFTVENIMEALSCGNKKAGQLLAELDDRKGIGLITREHQGLGRPDKIYVRKCIPPPDMSKGHGQTCQNDTSGDVETTRQDMSKRHTNNTEINKTEMSETDLIYRPKDLPDEGSRMMEERMEYMAYFSDVLEMEILKKDYPYDGEVLDEMLELIVDVCCSKRQVIRVAGDDKPQAVVKGRFMKLNMQHIQYVMDCLSENTTDVRNIKQYLLATLYNAPMTMGSYYKAKVNHDMSVGWG